MMKKIINRNKNIQSNITKLLKNEMVEDDLWHEFSADITPLNHHNRFVDIKVTDTFSEKRRPIALKKQVETLPQSHTRLSDFDHGTAHGLDSQSSRKIRRGKIKIQARLDLHGMIQTEAHISLLGFLEHAYETGKKLVLVITGKGLNQNGDIGVLRQAVPRWLNEQPMKNWIQGFNHAIPTDGGVGALYILLRRKR